MERLLKYFTICLFLSFNIVVLGEVPNLQINRYVEDINPNIYKGGPQVWAVEPGEDGYMFFATGFTLSVWDGVRWSSYDPGSGFYLRSLNYDPSTKRLYCAGDNVFGYWSQNEYGDFSFTKLYQTENTTNGNVFWRIARVKEELFLQTHENIYKYNYSKKQIIPIISNKNIGYIHNVDGIIYAQIDSKIYIISEEKLISLGINLEDRVVNIIKNGEQLYFFTENQGIYVLRNNSLEPINLKLNARLKELRVFSASPYINGSFLVGTVLDGAYIVGKYGDVVEKYDESSDLNFTTVLSLSIDSYGNIWLGLDGGIATIKNNPNESYYRSIGKKIGNVYAILSDRDKLYLGTNKGLFVVEGNKPARLIVNTQGQVWDILRCGQDIIVNHDKGLLRLLKDESLELIQLNSWMINQWYQDPNTYYVSDKTGFAIYEIKQGHLVFSNRLENYQGNFNRSLVDKYGNMWINGMNGKVRRLVIDKERRNVLKNTIYNVGSNDNWIYTNIIDNEVVFNSNSECYIYDIDKDSIVKSTYFSKLFNLMDGYTEAVIQTGNTFLLSTGSEICRVERINDKFVKLFDIFPSIKGMMIPFGFKRFQKNDNGLISLGFANGVAFYNLAAKHENHLYRLKLRKVEYTHLGEVKHTIVNDKEVLIEFPKKSVALKFFFTGLPVTYQLDYSIDNSPWKSIPIANPLEFAYIEGGSHILKLRRSSRDLVELVINFDIEKSFTSTLWFPILMLVGLVLLFFVVRIIIRLRIKSVHLRLLKRQEEVFERERIKHENELLALEIKERDKKLTSFAMNGIHINNMLNEIQSEILEINTDDSLIKNKLRSVIRKITSNRRNEDNWKVFEKYFNNVYDGFFDKLMERYPNLTNNDLKICAYIKLCLSTKEIAVLMNISPTSVETARHRLRRNLGISTDISLTELIIKI